MHWCGCDSEVLVWALTEEDAMFQAEPYMDDHMHETLSYDPEDEQDAEVDEDEFYLPTVYEVHEFTEEDGKMEWFDVVGKP